MIARMLDTNIVSFTMKSHPLAAVYSPHLTGYRLTVSFQTVAELLAGAALAQWGTRKRAALEAELSKYLIFHSDRPTCDRWAEVKAARRAQPISDTDCWIAATALARRVELVTHNPADFAGIPGLMVITEVP